MATPADGVRRRHRYSVEDYYRMATAGVLRADVRVELVEGEIIDMTPIGSRHSSAVMMLTQKLSSALGSSAIVSVQNPVRLDQYSELQPDIALLQPRDDFYRAAHPGPGDVLLIVEVSDASAAYDREIKLPLYARHGIPKVWLVDLAARRLTAHAVPISGAYTSATTIDDLARVPVPGFPAMGVDLSTLLD